MKLNPSFLQSNVLRKLSHIQHGFFSRVGGVSKGVYDSLNCSYGSNDQPENITINREACTQALQLPNSTLVGLNQIHSPITHVINNQTEAKVFDFKDGDALVTTEKNIALSVLGADCAPVIFACANKPIIGIAHAGWKGAATGVIQKVVDSMHSLGAKVEDIHVCIGPTIQQKNYEVKNDFILTLEHESNFETSEFITGKVNLNNDEIFYFNLPAYIKKQCQNAKLEMIDDVNIDTYSNKEYFSYRRNTHQQLDDYGRHISIVSIKD